MHGGGQRSMDPSSRTTQASSSIFWYNVGYVDSELGYSESWEVNKTACYLNSV
jgi:hypothetical protein